MRALKFAIIFENIQLIISFLASSLKMEIAQNVRRIQNHPSIAIWAGNNENEAALVQNW